MREYELEISDRYQRTEHFVRQALRAFHHLRFDRSAARGDDVADAFGRNGDVGLSVVVDHRLRIHERYGHQRIELERVRAFLNAELNGASAGVLNEERGGIRAVAGYAVADHGALYLDVLTNGSLQAAQLLVHLGNGLEFGVFADIQRNALVDDQLYRRHTLGGGVEFDTSRAGHRSRIFGYGELDFVVADLVDRDPALAGVADLGRPLHVAGDAYRIFLLAVAVDDHLGRRRGHSEFEHRIDVPLRNRDFLNDVVVLVLAHDAEAGLPQ